MQLWEIYFLIQEIPYVDKSSWEQTRILGLFICQKFVKKRLKLKDIFKLPFDDDYSEKHDFTEEEIVQIKQQQKQIEDYLNQK